MTRSSSALPRIVAIALATTAAAQCGPQWRQDPGQAGSTAYFTSTQWDPDGPGPLPPVLVVGGSFQTIGTVAANRLAIYDPVQRTYAAFGPGADGSVSALLATANGDLIAGGSFSSIGGVAAPGIARYGSGTWTPLGPATATPAGVTRLLEMPNGDLIAAGGFTSIGGVGAARIARWNGTTWAAMDVGFSNGVTGLAVRPNGELFAAGPLGQSTGNNVMNGVARWTGTGWATVGGGLPYSTVTSLCMRTNGDLLAGRWASTPNESVALWNGSTWSYVGPSSPPGSTTVAAMLEEPNGDVIAVGTTSTGTMLQRRTGTTWTALSIGAGPAAWQPLALARTAAGDLLIGVAAWYCAFQTRYANGAFTSDAVGFDYLVSNLAIGADGAVLAAGFFTLANGAIAPFVARHDGTTWQALGGGTDAPVRAMDVLQNGDVVIAGDFVRAGTTTTSGVARWNGTQWSPLPWLQPIVTALGHGPGGEIYAARPAQQGRHSLARSTGGAWTELGSYPWFNGAVHAIAVDGSGGVVAAGLFTSVASTAIHRVARWDGATWSALGTGMDQEVRALRVLANGDLVAGGLFTTAGGTAAPYVARWNGTAWSALGAGPGAAVTALVVLPNGDLLAGGEFPGGHCLARWNGSFWSPFGAPSPGPLWALAVHPDGRVLAAQSPVTAAPALGFLRELTPTCPATAAAYGTGCAGSAGMMSLSATALPWLGGTCRTVCSGFAANGVGLTLVGFAPIATPLASLVPVAAPGCTLLAAPDAVTFAFPVAGTVQWQLAVPVTAGLLGVQLRHQVGQVELGPSLQILAAAASNALTLTVGVL